MFGPLWSFSLINCWAKDTAIHLNGTWLGKRTAEGVQASKNGVVVLLTAFLVQLFNFCFFVYCKGFEEESCCPYGWSFFFFLARNYDNNSGVFCCYL